jgi:hypothetical protein
MMNIENILQSTESLLPKINSFDLNVMELQNEIEFIKKQRKLKIEFEGEVIRNKMKEFKERWLADINEHSGMQVLELMTGNEFWYRDTDRGFLHTNKRDGHIEFQFMMENYTFKHHPNDEFEDLDIHDFAIYYSNIDRDKFQRLGILWAELESLVPRLVYWNRESQTLFMDINVRILTVNMELKMMDEEMGQLKEKIKLIRAESLCAGHTVELSVRRFYYTRSKFEFISRIRIIERSKTGKTCKVEIHCIEKNWNYNGYVQGEKTYQQVLKLRMKRVVNGIWEE